MSSTLHVAVIQYDIIEADITENLRNVSRQLELINDNTALVVLPEMFTTGFVTDPTAANTLAETMDGRSITTMRKWAKNHKSAIVASLIIKENGRILNRGIFIDDTGSLIAHYDKRHLFAMSSESDTFTSGINKAPVITYKGFRISMAICYDLRFPVWMRNTGSYYDLMIVMANWPDSRRYAWEHLLIARAIENQAYVIGCNRTGTDNYGTYSGTSMIITPKGQSSVSTEGTILTADLDLDTLTSFRKKFPVYLHGDKFTIST